LKLFLATFTLAILFTNVMLVYAEPTLEDILDTLGFTNRALTTIETFEPGRYEITLYAEFAGYHLSNNLSWYVKSTDNFVLIFDGPEGNQGYTDPPITKNFVSIYEFGLCLWSPDGGGVRWFTETSRNSDGQKHAVVYQSLDDPSLFLIGFENLDGGHSDWDYNDMVVALKRLPAPVGGIWIPTNKLELLAPYILSASVILTFYIVVVVYVKHWEKRKNFSRTSLAK